MELIGQIVMFLFGVVLVVSCGIDILSRFQYGKINTGEPLFFLVPLFGLGVYLIYLVFS